MIGSAWRGMIAGAAGQWPSTSRRTWIWRFAVAHQYEAFSE